MYYTHSTYIDRQSREKKELTLKVQRSLHPKRVLRDFSLVVCVDYFRGWILG